MPRFDYTCAVEWYCACRGGAPRSESKSIDCRGQSHHNSIGNLPPATLQIQPVQVNKATPQVCHSDGRVSGVEESTTLEYEPPQDKASNSGRFLDSHLLSRNDMLVGGSVLPPRVVFGTLLGDESSPLHWVYHILRDTIHPHRLYSERGGRQIAAPTIHLFRFTVYLTCLSSFCARKM